MTDSQGLNPLDIIFDQFCSFLLSFSKTKSIKDFSKTTQVYHFFLVASRQRERKVKYEGEKYLIIDQTPKQEYNIIS